MSTAPVHISDVVSPVVVDVMEKFNCDYATACVIQTATREMRRKGRIGERPHLYDRSHSLASFVRHIERHAIAYEGVDKHNVAQHLHDAWLEEIQDIERLRIELDSTSADSVCERCDACLGNDADECDSCGSRVITRYVTATVIGPYARLWVEAEPYIDGTSWESDGDSFAHAKLRARPGLAEELKEEGYLLDESNYAEDDEEESL